MISTFQCNNGLSAYIARVFCLYALGTQMYMHIFSMCFALRFHTLVIIRYSLISIFQFNNGSISIHCRSTSHVCLVYS